MWRSAAWVLTLLLIGCGEKVPDTAPATVTGLRVNTVLGEVSSADYLRATEPRQFQFPADHGAHPGFRTEWWYLTATLADAAGNEYGLQYTLFRQALTPAPYGPGPWHTGEAYLGHLAVTDVAAQRHFEAQRLVRGHPRLAGVENDDGLSLRIDDWTVRQQPHASQWVLQLRAQQAGDADRPAFGVDVQVTQQQAIVLQGERGLSNKSADGGSYYYSMPRMALDGTLQLGDRLVSVTGLAWWDREWSTSVLPATVAGWDWFALQLHDGRSVMAFRLRRHDGLRDPYDHGVLVAAGAPRQGVVGAGDAAVQVLSAADYELIPNRFWQDQRGIRWPVSWTLQLPGETFLIEALVDDQVMDTAILYWEGIVGVSDAQGNDLGRGYMELTGYESNRKQ